MASIKELSGLLAALYAAPLEPEMWQVFLDRLCALTNTASSYMVTVDPEQGNVTLAGGGLNFNPETLRLYNEHYGANDPYAAPAMAKPRVGVIQAEELVSRPDLFRSELYNEVLHPYDLEHMVLLSCGCAEEAGLFPFWRSPKQGQMDSASLNLLETLLPHVQTALRLRTKVMASNATDLFSEAALDAMSTAALLVTGKGRVRHMNQLAAVYLRRGDGLRLHQNVLTATDSAEDEQLALLIAGASANGKNGSEAVRGGGALRVSRARSQGVLQVTVLAVSEQKQIAGYESSALVLISDPSSLPRRRTSLMQQLYGLTPAESRLADLLLEGIEVREAAEHLHITIGTARFHLKRVLAKTGSHRQTELLRLMLSLPVRDAEVKLTTQGQ
jgi:DNA-binding CsgD family transcriptional regulator